MYSWNWKHVVAGGLSRFFFNRTSKMITLPRNMSILEGSPGHLRLELMQTIYHDSRGWSWDGESLLSMRTCDEFLCHRDINQCGNSHSLVHIRTQTLSFCIWRQIWMSCYKSVAHSHIVTSIHQQKRVCQSSLLQLAFFFKHGKCERAQPISSSCIWGSCGVAY